MLSNTELVRPPEDDPRDDLLGWIRYKRAGVENHLISAAFHRRVLLNFTIIAGTLAAALTAAPALGGKSLAD